ncbi:MAG: trehalase family glycosidase, partial [Armatimonadota bacterium]
PELLERLKEEAKELGKPGWRPLLAYVAELHERSIKPPAYPFPYPWEEIGPGYWGAPAFGHWDIVHQIIDSLPGEPEHAKNQILNNLAAQQDDGLVPGVVWMGSGKGRWSSDTGHPPVWPVAVQDYFDMYGSTELLATCFEALTRQIGWFERVRKAEDGGFFYTDILNHSWESGVDEGVRFDDIATGSYACVDATAHVYWMYQSAARWATILGTGASEFNEKADGLREFMQDKLYSEETGLFYDIWAASDPTKRRLAYEGMWPMVVGAATEEQAQRVIDENLLDPDRFFTDHPISTVGVSEPKFELRMWRGPAWNSMTYWAARGCLEYGRKDGAEVLLERALDSTAAQFDRTGQIFEFYHPFGDDPVKVQRKPHTSHNEPSRDYLGHNPVMAMARLWEKLSVSSSGERLLIGL